MKIAIASGKGGTEKTSITASFSYLGGRDIVVSDCDVDAADMHLLLRPDFRKGQDFYSGLRAIIHPDILITGNGPGGNAAAVLEKAGLKIYIGAGEMSVKQAYDTYQKNELKEF